MKEKIFKEMEHIGWYLDDFDKVVDYDVNYLSRKWLEMDESVDKHESMTFDVKELEKLKDSIGFVIDFVSAVAIIDNTEKMKEEK